MKIAVIAANGRSGQVFVERALAAGHIIQAGVRTENFLKPHHNLKIVHCDATNEADLKKLMANQEAVASFIGHVKGSEPHVQTVAIQKVVTVMQQLGIRRLISLTGTGVRFPGDKVDLIDKLLNLGIRIIDPARIKDGKDHVEILKRNELDWTIIRVLKLQNVSAKPFKLREHGPTKWYVGRDEVAQAILQVLEEHSFINQAPIICRVTNSSTPII